jgi:hypothetical protein
VRDHRVDEGAQFRVFADDEVGYADINKHVYVHRDTICIYRCLTYMYICM